MVVHSNDHLLTSPRGEHFNIIMKKNNTGYRALLKFLLFAFLLPSIGGVGGGCTSDDPVTGALPKIAWSAMSSARFRIMEGETITIVPDVENTDETTTFSWTMDGEVVGTDDHYTFQGEAPGEYYLQFTVTNRYGKAKDEVKVTVLEQDVPLPVIPDDGDGFGWQFPWTEINMAQGRTLKVKAYMLRNADGATFSWTLDGTPVEGKTDEVAYVFTATTQGTHTLRLTMTKDETEVSQEFILNVCASAGTYRRSSEGEAMVDRVYEYIPAPGFMVNGYVIVGDAFPEGCTHGEACATALQHFQNRWYVSLGAQGGYLVAGFDHSVQNSGGDYDLCIKGNPYDYQSEPGIIWVSQDDNGDGLPNDQWFELAGSEYGTENETLEYAITYYRPEQAKSATAWRDVNGDTGYVPYLSYWNPHAFYWQDWVEGTERTYFGSRLKDRSTYINGISDMPPYDWGYADNGGSDFIDGPAGKMGYYKLTNARTWDGQSANLEYIDFVKIQTAQTGSTPNLGEISTEVYYIGDCHLQ